MTQEVILTKICAKCKCEKIVSEFYRDNNKKCGYSSYCKCCAKEKSKKYSKTISSDTKRAYSNTPEQKEKRKQYKKNNPEKIKEQSRRYREKNLEIIKQKDALRRKSTDHYKKKAEYNRKKRNSDPLYRTKVNITDSIRKILSKNRYKKNSNSEQILGCAFAEFYQYIENQFVDGMNWDNRSEWHLDHIVPIAFGETEQEIILLNHHTNFRPLWEKDNLDKKDKLTLDSINHPIYKEIIESRNCDINNQLQK